MLTDGPDISPQRTISLVCQGLEASWLTSLMQVASMAIFNIVSHTDGLTQMLHTV